MRVEPPWYEIGGNFPNATPLPPFTVIGRISAIDVGCPWRQELPLPTGTVDAGERKTVAKMYASL